MSVKLPLRGDDFYEIELAYAFIAATNDLGELLQKTHPGSTHATLSEYLKEKVEKEVVPQIEKARDILDDYIKKTSKRSVVFYMRREFFGKKTNYPVEVPKE